MPAGWLRRPRRPRRTARAAVPAPDIARPAADGAAWSCSTTGGARADAEVVADAARVGAREPDDDGGMVLLPDDGALGPAPVPPPAPQPPGEQIAAREG